MKLGLRKRIIGLVIGLFVANLFGAGLTILYTHTVHRIYSDTFVPSINMLILADRLEAALVMEEACMAYFFLSGDSRWLEKLETHHKDFGSFLQEAIKQSNSELSRKILADMELAYGEFVENRQETIRAYRDGNTLEAIKLHWTIQDQFHTIHRLAENFKQFYEQKISRARDSYKEETRYVTFSAMITIFFSLMSTIALGWVLIKQVLNPVRFLAHMLARTDIAQDELPHSPNEITELSRRVEKLLEVVDTAESALKESREHLIQSEKMALVGKLAAGVAHSVLNPLTSVKMRLYSLEKSLQLSPTQREDLEVVSEEIRHIETILRNFLEFSRPPKPVFQEISPSDVVDMVLQLLRHRLESYNVQVVLKRRGKLSLVKADPDQLKEVFVNLIINACEAMGEGGTLEIEEGEGVLKPEGRVVIIKIKDTGPGIPQEIADKIFEPFFTTKDDGSGLGLSISKRIVEDHGGWIHYTSQEGQGTTFVVAIPCWETGKWLRSW
ncbi:MAG: ATP-binding protein [Syntrophobacterales bacterium]|nr:ATP-binding protein [Syntrophobacterales bacterium]